MKNRFCGLMLGSMAIGIMATTVPLPASAYYQHHHKHAQHHHHRHAVPRSSPMALRAQISLANLGYYDGRADGMMGPMTIRAIKTFQDENQMPKTGKLTKDVYDAIIEADKPQISVPPAPPVFLPNVEERDTLAAQPGLTGPTNQQYADPLLGGPTVAGVKGWPQAARTQELSSRFAKLDVNENKNGSLRRYTFTIEGAPILEVEHQPTIIGISPTYNLNAEDGIILTTYRAGDPICPYKNYLLLLSDKGHELKEFGDCTERYSARKVEDSLFVTFPQLDDQRVAGATWRYEAGDLEKL